MAHTVNRIVIDADYEKVFEMSNDIGRWKEFFNEYTDSKVLKKEGKKITFELTHQKGTRWTSYRILAKEERFAYASRMEPMAPFQYMKIIWLYRETEGGTEMTWIQDFSMAPDAKVDDSRAEQMINEHSKENLKRFKEIIENS
ncbi:MAG: polyketide cyclase [Candidatus Omnitrophica bacterium]|nr:polyketide cyclase [Candidatus Omnitrophota bacterium]